MKFQGLVQICAYLCVALTLLSEVVIAETMTWNLAEDFRPGRRCENPNTDRYGEPTWHFLRTTSRTPTLASRQWLRDGKYEALENHGARLFDRPVDAWVKHAAGDYRQPVIGRFTLQHDLDIRFEVGDIFFAPGHDDACILGWRSPVSGTLEIEGSFQHAQKERNDNRGIQWYIERGPAPDPVNGFTPVELSTGDSRCGTASENNTFHVTDQTVHPGDFIYFIVDAWADGTEQPHTGDFTRLRLELTVQDVSLPTTPHFERDVLPILVRRCHDCHGADSQEGDLDLRTVESMFRGGKNGHAIVRGHPNRSYLMQLIQRGKMPPDGEERLTAEEISVLARWIRLGMPADEQIAEPARPQLISDYDREHWAFQKLVSVEPPTPQRVERVRTPVDAFVLTRLEEKEFGYSPEADRVTLVRRAYLDLVGLPPSPDQVAEFLADTAPGAFERLIDHLLESPQFGERWARHWLDVVGYADTVGFDHVPALIITTSGKWRYRDYVIKAFNDNKPYDEFIAEQIAGDESVNWRETNRYTDKIRENLIATGYLRTARDQTHEPENNIPLSYFDVLHDTVEIVGSSLLGITMQCARCHNHKVDPIPQEDYYRLMAIFTPAFNPDLWKPVHPYRPYIDDRSLLNVSPTELTEIKRHNVEVDQRIAETNSKIEQLRAVTRKRLMGEKIATLPESIRDDVRSAFEIVEDKRNEVQRDLVKKFEETLAISDDDVSTGLLDSNRTEIESLEQALKQYESQRSSWGKIQALFDVGPPPPTFMLERGDYMNPTREVVPGFLRVLVDSDEAALAQVEPVGNSSSGRRTALAQWLTDPGSPAGALVTRVMVNRIWQHLMGEGLVRTPGNFGVEGERPTHPELLEWLSVQFVEGGWKVKPMIRLMMQSSVYRQASETGQETTDGKLATGRTEASFSDPENRLLWRMNLKRLEAEVVRDSILAVSGKLDTTAGGPPVMLKFQSDGKIVVDASQLSTPTSKWRRSIYLLARRAYNLSMLSVFDQPLISTSCSRRDTSAVPLQSLTMMNDEFVAKHAEYFAQRLLQQVDHDPSQLIPAAFRTALARLPDEQEAALCATSLTDQTNRYRESGISDQEAREHALTELCHTLLNTSEFLYAE